MAFVIARIHEATCVGCTKCIQACPVDAIIGSAQQMHTVIQQECIGCKKCIEPCPVDCIELITINEKLYQPAQVRHRYRTRQIRLQHEEQQQAQQHQQQLASPSIQEALARAKIKALTKRSSHS